MSCFLLYLRLKIFPPLEAKDVIDKMRAADRHDEVMKYVCGEVTPALRERLDTYYDGTLNNLGLVSAAIRHIFVHGRLTANRGDSPMRLARMCDLLSDSILVAIDEAFSLKVEHYIEVKLGGKLG